MYQPTTGKGRDRENPDSTKAHIEQILEKKKNVIFIFFFLKKFLVIIYII